MPCSEASMAAAMVRRYSRGIGLSAWLSVTGTSGQSSPTIAPTRSSCAGSTTDQSRLTAIASTGQRLK